MASKSLGALTLDLIARIGSFTGPLDQASRISEDRMKRIGESAVRAGKIVGAGLAAGASTVTALALHAIKTADEITNLAAAANASTTEFQKYAAGASLVGVEQDKLADILKDVNDKVGDFMNTGGGALADFFEQIAPKVGITAEQFRNLSGPQALGLYVSSLEKARVSQADMTFYLEAIASDATALLPLLRNNAEGFNKFGDAAEAAGAIMDDKTIKAAQELTAAGWLMEKSFAGIGNQVTSALLPVLSNFAVQLSDTTINGVLARKVSDDLADSFKMLAKYTVATVGGIHLLATGLRGLSDLNDASMGEGAWWEKFVPPARVYRAFENFDAIKESISSTGTDLDGVATGYAELMASFEKPLEGKAKNQIEELATLMAELRKQSGKPGEFSAVSPDAAAAAKKAASEAAAASKKIQDAFESTETDYQRQIALINTTGDARKDASEAAKLQFEFESGKLADLSDQQKDRLKGLAEELDARKALQKANEDDKVVSAFQGSVDKQLTIDQRALDAPLLNAYDTDTVKQRALEMLSIEQDYQDQMADLLKQRDADDITQGVYDKETDALEEALEKRKKMQEKYYEDLDQLQQNGTAGFISGFATQAEASMDLYGNMQSVGADTFANLTDAMTTWAETGKLDAEGLAASFISSVGHALLSYAAAQVAMAGLSAFSSMIGIPFVGPAVAPGAAIAATAAAGVLMTAVGASLDGQAHDGIDFVPADGTWNLKKGERVTTAETSAKLDRTLERVSQGGTGGNMDVSVHNYAGAQVETQRDGDQMKIIIKQAKREIARDLAQGNGEVTRALTSGYGLRRAAR